MITLYGCVAMLALSNTGPDATNHPQKPAPRVVPLPKVPRPKPVAAKPKPKPEKKPSKGLSKKKAPSEIDGLLKRVEGYYKGLNDYQAEFVQTYTRVALSKETESRGILSIKKPGLMRWAYREPVEKLWVINGETLYVVDAEFEQVFVDKNFKTTDFENSISFLWGKGHLADTFNASLGEAVKYGAPQGTRVLELTPKQGATYRKLVLIVAAQTGEVRESILYETAGNTNRFKFQNARINPKLDRALFDYVPPPGWEIVNR